MERGNPFFARVASQSKSFRLEIETTKEKRRKEHWTNKHCSESRDCSVFKSFKLHAPPPPPTFPPLSSWPAHWLNCPLGGLDSAPREKRMILIFSTRCSFFFPFFLGREASVSHSSCSVPDNRSNTARNKREKDSSPFSQGTLITAQGFSTNISSDVRPSFAQWRYSCFLD